MKSTKLRLERLEGRDAPAILAPPASQYSSNSGPELDGRTLVQSGPPAPPGFMLVYGGGMDGIKGLSKNHNQTVRRTRASRPRALRIAAGRPADRASNHRLHDEGRS